MKHTDDKKQTQRIRQMERHLNRASAAIKRLSAALDKYEEAQESIAAATITAARTGNRTSLTTRQAAFPQA